MLALCAGAGWAAADADVPAGRPDLITPEAEAAIRRGLQYLVKSQQGDGSWRASGSSTLVEDAMHYPCTMTSLAGLALMAAGNTPHQGEHARRVQRAADFLLRVARENGAIMDPRTSGRSMYEHGFALLFLSQVYGMEQDPDRQRRMGAVLAKAAEFSSRCQVSSGGWPYSPTGREYRTGDEGSVTVTQAEGVDEGSVTVTQVQGLRAVRDAGVPVARATIERAAAMLTALSNPDGGIRYNSQTKPGAEPRMAITCAAMVTLHTAAHFDNPVAIRAREYVRKNLNMNSTGFRFYALLYAAQGLYLSGEEDWKRFFPGQRDWLVRAQGEDGNWTDETGAAFATSVALIVLQLPYGYVPVFQR